MILAGMIMHLSDKEIEEIDEFVQNHEYGNVFQTGRMMKFWNTLQDHESSAVIHRENGHIKGLLVYVIMQEKGVKGFLSKRCIVWGGPLVERNDKEILEKIIREFDETVSGKVIYTEFRNFFDVSVYKSQFEKHGYQYQPHLNYIVPVQKIKNGHTRISSSKKRQIKKSIKNGAKIIKPSSIEEIKSFYDILSDLYRRKVKKPLPSFDFFESFYHAKELGKYFLIEYREKIVGGILCPVFRDTIYEWYVGGEDGKHPHVYPSILATWAPIEYAMENNLEYFDFMGAGRPDDDYGVREFKSKFGGDLVEYGRFLKVHRPLMYGLGKTGVKVWGGLRSLTGG